MKFSWKVFLSTILLLCITFSLGSTILLSSWFRSSLEREISFAREENRILRFSLQTATASLPAYPQSDVQQLIQNVMQSIQPSTLRSATPVRLTDADGTVFYGSSSNWDVTLPAQLGGSSAGYTIRRVDDRYLIQYSSTAHLYGKDVYLESQRDATEIFRQRAEQFRLFGQIMLVLVAVNGLISYLLSRWLTRPIVRLSAATRRMAAGDYAVRAQVRSRDEMGDLAGNFNTMADSLEQKMDQLQQAVRRQEEFSGSFAHEVKTPLTSIIGYADLLRSRELAPQQRFDAANYIYQEGKRLESLSFKLLDLMVLDRRDYDWRPVEMAPFLQRLCQFSSPAFGEAGIQLRLIARAGTVLGDGDLLQTLCLNLLDNARKATPPGGSVTLEGTPLAEGYGLRFSDTGRGIPPEALRHLTDAFFRVDKSRARSQGGAGLGLTICAKIAALHQGGLAFSQTPGGGTTVIVTLKGGR